jgi:acyl-CoA synthetase (AMP-forming)/AMP-acid ligase II
LSDLFEELRACAELNSRRPAILAPKRAALSFVGLWRQMEQISAVLTGPHPITALILPDGAELLTALMSAMHAGTAAPLNPTLTEA